MINSLINGDCLEVMKEIPDKSVGMILADLPYGTTRNKWDSIIPLEPLWEKYERIIKDNGAIVLFAQTPFDKALGASNLKMLKYEWIWEKTEATGFLNAKKMPLKAHENILLFYKKPPTYNPQKTTGNKPTNKYKKHRGDGSNYGDTAKCIEGGGSTERYPRSVLKFPKDKQKSSLHPTQKPVALLEYLIKTYTNEDDIILDNVMGSGSTIVAAINTKRNYIGIEKDDNYYDVAVARVNKLLGGE